MRAAARRTTRIRRRAVARGSPGPSRALPPRETAARGPAAWRVRRRSPVAQQVAARRQDLAELDEHRTERFEREPESSRGRIGRCRQPARRRQAPQHPQRRGQLLVRDAAAVDQFVEAMSQHRRADARQPRHEPAHGRRSAVRSTMSVRAASRSTRTLSACIDAMKRLELASQSDSAVARPPSPGALPSSPRLRPNAARAEKPTSKTLAMRLRRVFPDEVLEGRQHVGAKVVNDAAKLDRARLRRRRSRVRRGCRCPRNAPPTQRGVPRTMTDGASVAPVVRSDRFVARTAA